MNVFLTKEWKYMPKGSVIHDVKDRGNHWEGIATDMAGSFKVSVPKSICSIDDGKPRGVIKIISDYFDKLKMEATRKETSDLIAAANEYAKHYDGDPRQDIKTDVKNAFFAGVKYSEQKAKSQS